MPARRPIPTLVLLVLAAAPCWALVQAQAQTATPLPPASLPAKARPAASAKVAVAPVPKPAETRPAWSELTVPQQQALQPLAGTWATISEAQKRKWLALSQNFPKLPPPEQAKLHSRMTEWVALSPAQRAQARLNFGETKSLSPDDKKAKWEAYQALPPEQKRKLAADAAAKPPTTAAAVKPVPRQKLATVPPAGRDVKTPRIAAGPHAEPGGLPLQPGAAPAAAPAN
jgi:hypothetical protein